VSGGGREAWRMARLGKLETGEPAAAAAVSVLQPKQLLPPLALSARALVYKLSSFCVANCLPAAAEGRFLLSDLLTARGQTLTIPLADAHNRPLPGCVAVLSAEELPNTNAVVRGRAGKGSSRPVQFGIVAANSAARMVSGKVCHRPLGPSVRPCLPSLPSLSHLPAAPALLQVQLTLAASRLDNKDTFGKSDPFLRISKAREGGAWVPVLKTEVSGAGAGLVGRKRCAREKAGGCRSLLRWYY